MAAPPGTLPGFVLEEGDLMELASDDGTAAAGRADIELDLDLEEMDETMMEDIEDVQDMGTGMDDEMIDGGATPRPEEDLILDDEIDYQEESHAGSIWDPSLQTTSNEYGAHAMLPSGSESMAPDMDLLTSDDHQQSLPTETEAHSLPKIQEVIEGNPDQTDQVNVESGTNMVAISTQPANADHENEPLPEIDPNVTHAGILIQEQENGRVKYDHLPLDHGTKNVIASEVPSNVKEQPNQVSTGQEIAADTTQSENEIIENISSHVSNVQGLNADASLDAHDEGKNDESAGVEATEHTREESNVDTHLTDEHSHCNVIVEYQEEEISLFPPTTNQPEQSQTYFLHDHTIASQSIQDMLAALRTVLADSVSESEELYIEMDVLDLKFTESTPECSSISLIQISDIYTELQRNDGLHEPSPLYMTLLVKSKVSTRLDALYTALHEGQGLSSILSKGGDTSLENEPDHNDEIIAVATTQDSNGNEELPKKMPHAERPDHQVDIANSIPRILSASGALHNVESGDAGPVSNQGKDFADHGNATPEKAGSFHPRKQNHEGDLRSTGVEGRSAVNGTTRLGSQHPAEAVLPSDAESLALTDPALTSIVEEHETDEQHQNKNVAAAEQVIERTDGPLDKDEGVNTFTAPSPDPTTSPSSEHEDEGIHQQDVIESEHHKSSSPSTIIDDGDKRPMNDFEQDGPPVPAESDALAQEEIADELDLFEDEDNQEPDSAHKSPVEQYEISDERANHVQLTYEDSLTDEVDEITYDDEETEAALAHPGDGDMNQNREQDQKVEPTVIDHPKEKGMQPNSSSSSPASRKRQRDSPEVDLEGLDDDQEAKRVRSD
ncbi:hypothetical protein MMC25_003994 [Agyrium rufum]|nr:hypothetical protein [Agyrium rufum]